MRSSQFANVLFWDTVLQNLTKPNTVWPNVLRKKHFIYFERCFKTERNRKKWQQLSMTKQNGCSSPPAKYYQQLQMYRTKQNAKYHVTPYINTSQECPEEKNSWMHLYTFKALIHWGKFASVFYTASGVWQQMHTPESLETNFKYNQISCGAPSEESERLVAILTLQQSPATS